MPRVDLAHQVYPDWAELQHFDIVSLDAGQATTLMWIAPEYKMICVSGSCRVEDDPGTVMTAGNVWDAPQSIPLADDRWIRIEAIEDTTLVLLEGSWSEDTGGSGAFGVKKVENAVNRGDPAPYGRNTAFDNHYHDCDEYWIIVEGDGVAVSEGESWEIQPGDCIVTGAGDHHDFPEVFSPVRAAFFETTLLGARRRGHLWEHTHGMAKPQRER
jgi:mannose-6-phosphate isomerase-like protein (cupin superfamily)